MTYEELIRVDQGLAQLLDAKITNGTADLYFKLQRASRDIQAENELFQKTQEAALSDIEDEEEKREVLNSLLKEEVGTELPTFSYEDLEKFEGMTFRTISLLAPVLEDGYGEVIDSNIIDLEGDE